MASNIKNVKLGVCKITYDGNDLGYTQGGVDVSVKTDTHKVNVDQFGKTPINEYIMGREVMVKAPLAETTLSNLVAIMPGAVLVATGATVATGSVTIATNPVDADTIILNGVTVTFKTVVTDATTQVAIGSSANVTAANLATFVTASVNPALDKVDGVAAAAVVTLTYVVKGAAGNTFTLASGTAGVKVTVSGATLTGGADGTPARVDVPTGIGTNLLSIARPLVLHPISLPDNDKSEDFTVYLAATAGALQFAYKLENERVFSCEFNGYPDSTGRLFGIGDPAAV